MKIKMVGQPDLEYPGIEMLSKSSETKGKLVVIAWFDGEPELWVANNEDAIKEIHRYYKNEGWEDGRVLIQGFKEAA